MLTVTITNETPARLRAAFTLGPQDTLAVLGPSGAGKTSLLRTLAGLIRPAQGQITLAGQVWLDTDTNIALPPHKRPIAMAFQSHALFPHLSALDHLLLAQPIPDRAEAQCLLTSLGLDGHADRKPAQLSGGQQQRLGLARALARRASLLLLDEPFSATDKATRARLHSAVRAAQTPTILVTHDLEDARALATHILILEAGDIRHHGPLAQILAHPPALRALGLRDIASRLPAKITAHHPDGLTSLATEAGPLLLPRLPQPPGTRVEVRLMAHDIILATTRPQGLSAQNILTGHIVRLTPGEGPGVLVHIALGQSEIIARITNRAATDMALTPGQPIHAILKSMAVAPEHIQPV